MPIDYKEYHPKWSLISRLIRYNRAANKCEFCNISNGSIIKRNKNGTFNFISSAQLDLVHSKVRYSGYSFAGALKHFGFTKIILTVAHLDHDKTHNRFNNLAALCQKCHLMYDSKQHASNRKYGCNYKQNNLKLEL